MSRKLHERSELVVEVEHESPMPAVTSASVQRRYGAVHASPGTAGKA